MSNLGVVLEKDSYVKSLCKYVSLVSLILNVRLLHVGCKLIIGSLEDHLGLYCRDCMGGSFMSYLSES